MSERKNRESICFRPDLIFTFHFWQHRLDAASFQLDMKVSCLAMLSVNGLISEKNAGMSIALFSS